MRAVLRAVLAFALLCVFATAAIAERRVALIVANGAYKGAELQNPAVDADLVAVGLRAIGFTVSVVKDADLGAFDAALRRFGDEAKGADIALFYFAGHGFAVNDGLKSDSVLMSTSADVTAASERVLRAGGIPLDDIAQSLAGLAGSTLIFIDACRNDPRLIRALGGKGRGLGRLEPVRSASIFIGLSTRLGDTAEDGDAGKGSPFARAFATTMQAPGVRIDDAFRRLREAVRGETSGRQVPDIIQDDLPDGAIVLVKGNLTEPAIETQSEPAVKIPPSTDATPVVAEATLLEEQSGQTGQGKAYRGTTAWRTQLVSGGADASPETAVVGEVNVPDRKLKVALTLRRNSDPALPAAHTLQLQFVVPADSQDFEVENVANVLLKSSKEEAGGTLTGGKVKVTKNVFLIGLQDSPADRGRNARLLEESPWIDIPILYANGGRAILTLEKGSVGDAVFKSAFAVWKGIDAAEQKAAAAAMEGPVGDKVTIPDGLSSASIVDLLAGDARLTGAMAAIPPEGSLLPGDYPLATGSTRADIVAAAQAAEKALLDRLWNGRSVDLPLKTPTELVTLASIVEQQSTLRAEWPHIAGVLLNRLHKGMRLQSDPTVVYGITAGRRALDRALTKVDLERVSLYNTYLFAGLPPGPIGNPSQAALEAVAQPLATKDLYFVGGPGGHLFAETLAQHAKNVAAWRKAELAKGQP